MNNNDIPFDDEPTPTVVEKPESNPLAKIEEAVDPLIRELSNMVVETEEQRTITHAWRGDIKKAENIIKEYVEDNITPLDNKVKRLKKAVKPYSDKLKELVDVIKLANQKYDTAKLKAADAEKKKAEAKLLTEQKAAAEKVATANKKGEEIPEAVIKKLQETVDPSITEKRKTDKGTESVKLEWQWWIILHDGTEWDKKSPLPVSEVPGYSSYEAPFFGVLAKPINAAFKPGKPNCGLPYWIKTDERAKSAGFRG
jgi:hypothetical protein